MLNVLEPTWTFCSAVRQLVVEPEVSIGKVIGPHLRIPGMLLVNDPRRPCPATRVHDVLERAANPWRDILYIVAVDVGEQCVSWHQTGRANISDAEPRDARSVA
jgi:hypothetical protein